MKPALWNGGGGDEEDRTPDLGIANAALSQLSYVPTIVWMIPPLRSIPNRQPRRLADERPWHCGKRNTPAATPVFAMPPMTQTGPPGFPDGPAGSGKDHGRNHTPSPDIPRISLMPAASAASRRSSHAAACGWSAGRRWVRRQPRRPPGRSHGRYAPRLPGLPPDP